MRGTHTFASVLARVFSKFGIFRGSDNPYYMISVSKPLRRAWQLLEFVSVLPILFARFLLSSALGFIVIAERYLPDFIAWVATTTNDPGIACLVLKKIADYEPSFSETIHPLQESSTAS